MRIAHGLLACLAAVGLLFGLAACGADPGPALGDLERETFDGVNDYRADQGLPALIWNETLAEVCRGHSADMAAGRVDFGHDGFEDRVATLAETFAYDSIAENVSHNWGQEDPARVAVIGWINSPGHEENMTGDYELSGMGVVEADPGEYYFTQMFLRER